MKNTLKNILTRAVKSAFDKGLLSSDRIPEMEIEAPRHASQGDFASNIAMVSASIQKMAPVKIAQAVVSCIDDTTMFEKIDIAGPGFINFFMAGSAWTPVVETVLAQDHRYGASDIGRNRKIQVEFVSSNPTGPLHVGHGRGAAVGDSMGNILSFAGFDVQKEYYINDSGRQIRTLGRSVWLRAQQINRPDLEFPDDCYQGGYIKDIAQTLLESKPPGFIDLPEDEAVPVCARFAVDIIMAGIRQDLADFGVEFDRWFSEQSLYDSGMVDQVIAEFKSRDLIYEKDGALWFRTADFGDEKDRVVVRNNGMTTYFASDIAYHIEKYSRGFDKVIDVWGADHHGYIKRMTAAIVAAGREKEDFEVILVQLVTLLRGGNLVQMSTRAGEFVTLQDIVREVGADAARFLFLSRSYDSGLDFDLELARQKNSDNPVYYVQYVHARIAGILDKATQAGIIPDVDIKQPAHLSLLAEPEEMNLLKLLSLFPEQVEKSALSLHPNVIFTYLMNLASAFHGYYNRHKVITDDRDLSFARLCLVLCVKKVIRNGMALLGVSVPERM